MTKDADFKAKIRQRMAETGETYTQALAALTGSPDLQRGHLTEVIAYDREQARQVARRAAGQSSGDVDAAPAGSLLRQALQEAHDGSWRYTDERGHRYDVDLSRFLGLDPDDTYLSVCIGYPNSSSESGPEPDHQSVSASDRRAAAGTVGSLADHWHAAVLSVASGSRQADLEMARGMLVTKWTSTGVGQQQPDGGVRVPARVMVPHQLLSAALREASPAGTGPESFTVAAGLLDRAEERSERLLTLACEAWNSLSVTQRHAAALHSPDTSDAELAMWLLNAAAEVPSLRTWWPDSHPEPKDDQARWALGRWMRTGTSAVPMGWSLDSGEPGELSIDSKNREISLRLRTQEDHRVVLQHHPDLQSLRGRRIRLHAAVQVTDATVGKAGIAIDVWGRYGHFSYAGSYAFRYPSTQDWQEHDLVVDIHPEATHASVRVILNGPGEARFGPVLVEDLGPAGDEVGHVYARELETDSGFAFMVAPTNLGFDEGMRRHGRPQGWGVMGSSLLEVDAVVRHSPQGCSARLEPPPGPYNYPPTLWQSIPGRAYAGRKVRFDAWVRTDGPARSGAFALVMAWTQAGADEHTGQRISGTADWTLQSLEVDVPEDCYRLTYGVRCEPGVTVWVDDCAFSATAP